MRHPIIAQKKILLAVVVFLLAPLVLSSCADKQLTPMEKQLIAAEEAMDQYTTAYNAFQSLEKNLPPGEAQEKLDQFREPMNDLHDAIVSYVDVVLTMNIEDAQQREKELTQKSQKIIMDLIQLGLKYGVEVKEEDNG